MREPVIGIWHPGSSSNYGDRAIQEATIDLIRGRWPNAEIIQYDPDPVATSALYRDAKVHSRPCRVLGFPPSSRDLAELDVLLWGGGSLIQQSSMFHTPLHLMAAFAAARRGVKVAYFGTGVEPLDSRLLRWLVRRAFRNAFDDGFVRGHLSAGLLESYGAASPVRFAVDQACSLELGKDTVAREALERAFGHTDGSFVSVSIKPTFIYRGGFLPVSLDLPSPGRHQRRLRRQSLEAAFADLVRYLVDVVGVSVLLVPMYYGQGDLEACQRVAVSAKRDQVRVLQERLAPRDLKALFGLMDAHVGVRLHSCILATGAGVPSLGIQYMTKHREYFELLGIDGYLLREDDITAEALISSFNHLWENRAAIGKHLEMRTRSLVAGLRDEVESVFDSVWSIEGGET